MSLSHTDPPQDVQGAKDTRLIRCALEISTDIILTLLLIAGLTIARSAILWSGVGSDFVDYISRFHEWACLVAYLSVAMNGIVRIAGR